MSLDLKKLVVALFCEFCLRDGSLMMNQNQHLKTILSGQGWCIVSEPQLAYVRSFLTLGSLIVYHYYTYALEIKV